MSTIVIMPGGFHPFHAGHAALYNSIKRAFPDAEVYVAATNDTSSRPFPFAVKEKLARLAGVEPGHFVQVKSPFRAEEITSRFDPDRDRLIFVRSEKDADKQPLAGGVKKNGEPAYLQPLLGAKRLEPFARHAYMAYLPTVEFGPGMTSATEIRTAWPTLNPKRKTALVMSLYPDTQKNPKLAANVVAMLDTAIGGELAETTKKPSTPNFTQQGTGYKSVNYAPNVKNDINLSKTIAPPQSISASGSLIKNKLNNTLPDDAKLIQILKRGLDAYYEYIEDGIITDLNLTTIKELLIQNLDNNGLVDPDQFAYDASREIDFFARMGETADWEAAFYEVAQRVNAHIKNNKKHGIAEGLRESKMIDAKMIDVFYRPDPHSHARRVVAKNIPASILDRLLEKLSDKFAVPATSFEWEKADPVDENQGFAATLEAKSTKCPPATQDITLNLKNRQKAIDEYGYGPLNPDMPNRKFWMSKQAEWNLDSPDEAKSSLCGNCAAFDQRTDTLDCIAQGIGSDQGAEDPTIDAGDLGYCRFLKFKCASRRTCDAWVTGGPLVDKKVTEMDAQNFVGGMTASYQQRENQPVAEDYAQEKRQ